MLLEGLERRALLASFVPNSFADEIDLNPGNGVVDTASGDITLRAAVMEANAVGGSHTIMLGPGTYELSIAGGLEDGGLTGDIDISTQLTIQGAGAASTSIDGNSVDRVFHILAGANVKMSGLTITGGRVQGDPGSLVGWSGGGITNNGTLEMTDCTISHNRANEPGKSGDAGGIFNADGILTLLRVTFFDNVCLDAGGGLRSHGATARATVIDSTITANIGFSGGGIMNTSGSELTLINTGVIRNVANGSGGGVRSEDAGSVVTITGGMIHLNTATFGGGLYNVGGSDMTLVDSTITQNTATGAGGNGGGGGFNSGGPLVLRRVTVSGNHADNAAGGGIRSNGAVAVLTIADSTISGNIANNGGGLANAGGSELNLINSTVSGNQSNGAAGIYNGASGNDVNVLNSTIVNNIRDYSTTPAPGDIDNPSGGVVIIQNSIVGSVGTSAGATVLNSLGNNIITSATLTSGFHASDQLGANPLLGPLANNGGPTQTHALLPGSPALNTANTAAAPATDQRGAPRPTGPQADIGAYEFDDAAPSVLASSFEFETGHAISIQFSENVGDSLQTGDLIVRPILANGSLGTAIAALDCTYDPATNTALFTLPLLADQNYRANVISNDVTDIAGNSLNQNFQMDFFVLAADANRDRIVDLRDLFILSLNWLGTGKIFSQGDFDYDGDTNKTDLSLLAGRWQLQLAPPLVPAAAQPTGARASRAPARTPVRLVEQVGLTS